MDPQPPNQPRENGEAEIELEAAAWLARRDRGLSAREQDDFFQWLAADPHHGEWIARHQQTVKGLKLLAQWRPEHGARPNPDLLAHPSSSASVRRHRRWRSWLAGGLAAAAGLAGAFSLRESPPPARPAAVAAIPAPTAEPALRRLLEDGSSIDLNRGAEVEVTFTADERRVRLVRGEAHFTVTKNPSRPFIVQANRVSIRAVGTAFDVRLQPETVEVLVTEGSVSVNPVAAPAAAPLPGSAPAGPGPAPALVSMGERAIVSLAEPDAAPRVAAVAATEVARLLAWQPRLLEFVDAPLAQVVAEFNRDNRVKLVVADPQLAALPIGATLRSDNAEGFVRLLEASFQVAAERRADGVIVLRPAAAGSPR